MTEQTLPTTGLALVHDRSTAKSSATLKPRQIIQLDSLHSIADDIVKSLRNNEPVRLRLGKVPAIQYGKQSISLHHRSDKFSSDVFAGPLDGSRPMYFSGKLSHTLEVQKAKEATAKSDEALAALKNTLKTTQEQLASNEPNLVKTNGGGKKDLKPIVVAGRDRFLSSTPASPFLAAGRSPGFGPTSTTLLPTAISKEKLRLDAMRIPMVHLLAIGPMTVDQMATTLNVSYDECEKALDKVSWEVNGKRELKEKLYRELDVWKFPYKTQEERKQAIDHARHAYDRTRLERNDILWQLLLPKDERGKGTVLSRLDFGPNKHKVPTKPVVSAEKEVKGDASERDEKEKEKEKATKPKVARDVVPKKKPREDGEAKVTKSTAKLLAKLAKKESKYKSSERVEDSDEEAEAASKNTVKSSLPVTKVRDAGKEKPKARPTTQSQMHKPRLSDSSLSGAEGSNTFRSGDREKLKPRPRSDTTSSKKSPRARADSSPQKPSPLGSSPPTNSTDLEESSKGSTQSSAPSSPPSSNDIPLAQQHRRYSPVVGANSRDAVKRKSDRSDDEPPAKKQQVNGDRLNSLPKSLTSQLQQSMPDRRSSGSSASSPDKSKMTKQDVIANAKSFTSYYSKYRDLHERLSRLPTRDREDREIDTLWKMHKRLEEMKADIWDDWARLGGGVD